MSTERNDDRCSTTSGHDMITAAPNSTDINITEQEQKIIMLVNPVPTQIPDHFAMATWAQLAWSCAFTLMLIIAIGGNIIVIWIVVAHRRMRSVTNYFLVNLSVTDLLMSIFNSLFNFIYMIHSDWWFGELYCAINNFIATSTVAASVFTLTCISWDRYVAIVYPLQPRMSKRCALITIALVWQLSMIVGSPCLIYSSIHSYSYQVTFMVVTYFIPIFLMVGFYSSMSRVLWDTQAIGEMSQRQSESIRSKRKVVKMFVFILIVFCICWFPYNSYFIYIHYDRSILYKPYVQHLYLSFYFLAMSNAMVNPLIYYWMNARFREYFKAAICCWQKVLSKNRSHRPRLPGTDSPQAALRHSNSVQFITVVIKAPPV